MLNHCTDFIFHPREGKAGEMEIKSNKIIEHKATPSKKVFDEKK